MARPRRARGSGCYDVIKDKEGKKVLYYRYRVGVFDPVTKKTKYKSIKAKSRNRLDQKVADWRRENKGKPPAPPVAGKRLTVRDLVENFLETMGNLRQDNTVLCYQKTFRKHLIPKFGDQWVGRISSLDLQNHFLEMGKTLKSNTVLRYKRDISTLFNYAVKHNLIPQNPVSAVELPRFRRPNLHIPDEKDVVAILAVAKSGEYEYRASGRKDYDAARPYLIRRNYLIVLLAASCGMRLGEILGLTWKKVNEGAARIEVTQSLQDLPGRRKLKCTKTENERAVSLPATVAEELREWRQFSEEYAKKYAGFFENPLSLVFTKDDGDPVTGSSFTYRIFRAICKAAGVENCRVHDLRHFAISYALSRGVSVIAVAEQAGHADVKTTLNRYAHTLQRSRDELKNMLDSSPLFR